MASQGNNKRTFQKVNTLQRRRESPGAELFSQTGVLGQEFLILQPLFEAGVAKLVDALDLGSSAERLGGSSPSTRTETDRIVYQQIIR